MTERKELIRGEDEVRAARCARPCVSMRAPFGLRADSALRLDRLRCCQAGARHFRYFRSKIKLRLCGTEVVPVRLLKLNKSKEEDFLKII